MRSQAQRAYLHIHHPEIAARFETETGKGKLPRHVKKKHRKKHSPEVLKRLRERMGHAPRRSK
jgi:hypothetical protein